MNKKLYPTIVFCLTVLSVGALYLFNIQSEKTEIEAQLSVEELREKHKIYLNNSPFKNTLTWDKKKRKQNGLPPNRYFEQMWELTLNPSTGRLDDGELSLLREQLVQQRGLFRSPGSVDNAWVERGPDNVGGRTRVIMFDPNDLTNNTVYAGGVSGGLWKNTNISSAASTWARVDNVPGNLSVTSITVDPRNSNIWYVGTGEQYTAGDVVGNGVYVTTDGGTTWNAINIPPADSGDINFSATNLFLSGIYYVNDILAWDNGTSTELFVAVGAHIYGDAANPNNWLGLQSSGIYRSTDGGANWNRIESANMQHSFGGETYYYIPNDFEVGADNRIWVGTISSAIGEGGGRVFSSTNGSTWTEAAASPLTDSDRVELECSATNANKIYALTEGNSSPVHIYETTNAFGSITSLNLPNDADTNIAANDFCRGQAFYDLVIEADPADDDTFYVGGIDLFKTTNGGTTYTQLSHWYGGFGYQFVHADQHSIAFGNNSSTAMLFGHDGGISYSSNAGGTISTRNNGYNVTQFVKAGIGPDGTGDTNGIFSAGAQDNGTQAFRDGNTSPGINSSEELSDGDGFYTFVDKDGDYMIATYVFNVIYRFDLPWDGVSRINGGATSLANSQTTGDFVNQMGYDDDANRLLSNNSSGTSYSIRSINVNNASSGTLSNATNLTSKPTAFRASPFAANTWYVGTANGGLLRLTNVTNSSATWTTITTPFVGSVSSVRFGETFEDLIVTIHNYGVTSIWYSDDEGQNWVSKEGDLPNIPVRDFLLNPLSPNEAIVATQLGVWQTIDFDTANPSWTQSYNGMSDVSVTSLDYWDVSGDDTTNQVIASTYGRGVFTGSFTEAAIPDTEAPAEPTNLTAANITANSVDLSWDASTDNIAVTEYEIYQDGVLIATIPTTSYQVTGLSPLTNYDFYVIAKDAAGNSSPQSNTVSITTLAPDTESPTTPLNLLASNVTDTTVDLAWEASTDNLGVVTYDVYQDGTLIANVPTTNYQVTSLTPETIYVFKVIAKDAAGNESEDSNEVAILTLPEVLSYCVSESENVDDEYISRVQLNTIDNSSDAQFYSDFTNISTTLRKGNQYTITITPTWTGTIYSEGYAVWIDYNKDGDFEDSGELVFSQAPTTNTPISGNFTIPLSATETDTRMRVSLKYNGIPTSCEEFTWGEVEDYTVKLIGSGDLIYTNSAWTPYAPSALTGTDNAIVLDGTYTVTDDIQINDIRVNTGAGIIIEKAKSLSVNGNLITNDNVILESDSNEYASLIVNNFVIGNVQYKRHVNTTASTGGNDLIAPPVFGESFLSFRQANPNIVSNTGSTLYLFGPFDKVTDTYVLYTATETAPMYAGIGYRSASTDASTFTFDGLVTTRALSLPIVNNGPNNPEWNLVGNPYPSYIKLSDFLSVNSSQFDTQSAGIYGYDGNASNGWEIWNQAYSDANPNAIITPGQGFLVASATNNGLISFTPTMRSIGSSDDFILGRQDGSSSIVHLQLELSHTTQGVYKTDFYFTNNASNGMDFNYDSSVFGDQAPSNFALYSHLLEDNNGIDMAIQSLGFDALSNAVIPLGVHIAQGQQLTISISESTLPENIEVYLEDSVNNTFTLLNNSDYTITLNEDLSNIGRYFLRFNEDTLSTVSTEDNTIEIYTSTNTKVVYIKGQLIEDTDLSIYDIQGRLVKHITLDSAQTTHRIDASSIARGAYIVALKNSVQKKTQKVVIN
ncbi:fibronectin type III domain-containing protein [Psychroserpens algicola]|uniref:GEVED domain-containing protein n=1 Tax=Psychroserpens algicola TaxID=1719034 RepID=A0ABT0H3K8_9FLAO|nr:GEVED domain-containing protein [Psychroserpens algicola]MCK8478976.1 GEVED domain-containing protein [Psychroserpens algicola]